jgi:hypothetical protein
VARLNFLILDGLLLDGWIQCSWNRDGLSFMCPMKSIFIQSSTRKIIIIIEVVVIAMHLVRKVPLQPINE